MCSGILPSNSAPEGAENKQTAIQIKCPLLPPDTICDYLAIKDTTPGGCNNAKSIGWPADMGCAVWSASNISNGHEAICRLTRKTALASERFICYSEICCKFSQFTEESYDSDVGAIAQ
jgi:hypothetical protein